MESPNFLGSILSALKNDAKVELYCTLALMPVWFLGIYLFGPIFILSYPIYIPIILSYCLALCSFPLWYGIVFIVIRLPSPRRRPKELSGNGEALLAAMGMNSLSIIYSIYKNYTKPKPNTLRPWVEGYIHWLIGGLIVFVVIRGFTYINRKVNEGEKEEKKTEEAKP